MIKLLKNILTKIGITKGIIYLKNRVRDIKLINSELLISQLLQSKKYQNSKRLNQFEYQVLSQSGEDGIIDEIFKRIGVTDKYFVEFGIGDGLENNTGSLIIKKWCGLWIESDLKMVKRIKAYLKGNIHNNNLMLMHQFITKDNIEKIFSKAKVPPRFDLLSIDIDGNDYWVWKAIKDYSPSVVIMEYNAALGPSIEWIMPYNSHHTWDGSSYYGASLKSLEKLGEKKGYKLVGCNLMGMNAFFVRKDLVKNKFLSPFTSENHFEPLRDYIYCRSGHPLNYKIFNLK